MHLCTLDLLRILSVQPFALVTTCFCLLPLHPSWFEHPTKNCKSKDSVRLCGMPPLGKRHFHLQENETLQFKHAHFSDFSIYVQSQGHALMLASRELDSLAAKWSERKRNTLHQNKQTLTCRQKSETSPRRVQKFTSSWDYSSRHKTQN